jgi:hypothetical protein
LGDRGFESLRDGYFLAWLRVKRLARELLEALEVTVAQHGCDVAVGVVQTAKQARVEVSGDLDMAQVQELAVVLDGLCLDPPAEVVLDLEGLDPGCYSPLILIALLVVELRNSACTLRICGPGPMVDHIYHLGGFDYDHSGGNVDLPHGVP